MVCGFGEQVGYETLVRKIAKQEIDKSSRFTDWSRRPLSNAQAKYALADVTHLRQVYEFLAKKLRDQGRAHWVDEEMKILNNPDTSLKELADVYNACKKLSFPTRLAKLINAARRDAKALVQQENVRESTKFKTMHSYLKEHVQAHQSMLREQRLRQLNSLKDAAIKKCRPH